MVVYVGSMIFFRYQHIGIGNVKCSHLGSYSMTGWWNIDFITGADPGGGGSWGSGPPPLFLGTPKLHKEGKNVARMRTKTLHFST